MANLNVSLPIESEVADTIVSLSVLEHLYEPQFMLNEYVSYCEKWWRNRASGTLAVVGS